MNIKRGIIGVGNNVSYKPRWQSPHLPAATVMASGAFKDGDNGWVTIGNYDADAEGEMIVEPGKPIYRIPTMKEVKALPWNGYKVASTFSGTGGSCLGYRMAGFQVVYANEFVPAAQDCYRTNHPTSFLDVRDIRKVSAEDILASTGMRVGELDVFDGSPPCASFSSSGKREKGWGTVKDYSDTSQRTDDLFFEYVRLLKGLQPKTFIAENVSGLVKGTAKGYFLLILQALRDAGYTVKAEVCDAQWLGVPQCRQRVIFMGVRNDLTMSPVYPKPFPYRYSIREVLPQIDGFMSSGYPDHWKSADEPYGTVMAGGGTLSPTAYLSTNGYIMDVNAEKRKFTIDELKVICSFPEDFILQGSFAQQWERCGRSVPPLMMRSISTALKEGVLDKLPRELWK